MRDNIEARELFEGRRGKLVLFASTLGKRPAPVLKYGVAGIYAYEVCKKRILNGVAYGVLVINRKTGENVWDKDRCFDSIEEYEKYIGELRRPVVVKGGKT
jgi:hypothetical protein